MVFSEGQLGGVAIEGHVTERADVVPKYTTVSRSQAQRMALHCIARHKMSAFPGPHAEHALRRCVLVGSVCACALVVLLMMTTLTLCVCDCALSMHVGATRGCHAGVRRGDSRCATSRATATTSSSAAGGRPS